MKLLVIGGSQFVGRHLVEAASARGDQVTVFNRGQTPAEWPPGVEVCHGDRKDDLAVLAVGTWDAVVDCCAYLPRDVVRMAEALLGRVGRYVLNSSVSVYADFTQANHERSLVGRIDDRETDVVDGRTYGPLKALCEEAVSARFGDRGVLIRPLAQTVSDTLAWHRSLPADQQAFTKAGLSPEREAAALEALLRG